MDALYGGKFAWASRVAGSLWPAWRGLQGWEETVDDEIGDQLGDVVLLLWAVHRFAGLEGAEVILDLVLDSEALGPGTDPILHDIVQVAFAMGASWAGSRGRSVSEVQAVGPRLRVLEEREET